MRHVRIIAAVLALVAAVLVPASPARAATLPTFPMLLPVAWGKVVQGGGTHTHASGVRSSVDLGAQYNVSVPVVAVADGTVTVKGANGWARCYVVIEHQDGWATQYYHLKNIPSTLQTGQKVTAGTQLGMTGMPGSESCGRGSFRHVHLTLYRNGVEQPISGLSLGGYTVHSSGGSYCGYWTRNSDGAIVADARSACLAVPKVSNTVMSVDDLRAAEAPATSSDASALYTTDGTYTLNGRDWRTSCAPYSSGKRCFTEIWASRIVPNGRGGYSTVQGWVFNNLTYTGLTRAAMAANPLGHTGEWTSDTGRLWRTECDTAASGGNGCRTWIWATTLAGVRDVSGAWRAYNVSGWVVNNLVSFAPVAAPVVTPSPSVSVTVQPAATVSPVVSPSVSVAPSVPVTPTVRPVTSATAPPAPSATVELTVESSPSTSEQA